MMENGPSQKTLRRRARIFFKNSFRPGHSEVIGTITLGHLAIEKKLYEYVSLVNPNIGDISDLQLGFKKILEIALRCTTADQVKRIGPPLRAFNKVRNSLVHTHQLEKVNFIALKAIADFLNRQEELTEDIKEKFKDNMPLLVFSFVGYVEGYLSGKIDEIKKRGKQTRLRRKKVVH